MEWIGVDFDGTLATYDDWRGVDVLGEPVKPMVDRVKDWLAEGRQVRIFTARVSHDGSIAQRRGACKAGKAIENWCKQHIGRALPVTNVKDYNMVELWDDRAIQVIENTGEAPLATYSRL